MGAIKAMLQMFVPTGQPPAGKHTGQLPQAPAQLPASLASTGIAGRLQAAQETASPLDRSPGPATPLLLPPPPPKLTPRERTVLELVAEGKLNREIGTELGITTKVV